jgi:hypothetical protein
LLLVTLLLPGCGYSTAELYRDDVRTVALPIFGNDTFERGVETELTEALAKEIQRRTPYTLAAARAVTIGTPPAGGTSSGGGEDLALRTGADTELTGTVVSVRRQRLSRTANTGLPQEIQVRVIADVQWRDRRSGQVLMERAGLEEVGRYIPAGNQPIGVDGGGVIGEPFAVAERDAVARLARAVVDAMRQDF